MSYKIPLFDLNFGKEEQRAILSTLESRWISMGPNVKQFEQEFANHASSGYCVALSSCTAALHLALKILGVKKGDEVIVPSLTFAATANAVLYVGATPVFADITSYQDLSISPVDIEEKISPKTKVIIPMHYGGFPCDMNKILELSKKYSLYVVEDAAHAPNSFYHGKRLGTLGDVGCFSFFSNKNITCAEGGMLSTNTEEYAASARLLRSHGMTTSSFDRSKGHAVSYDVVDIGYNYRLDDIRASLLISQLKKLNADTEKRALLRNRYINLLEDNPKIIIPYTNNKHMSSNYIFPILLKNSTPSFRGKVRDRLKQDGIETSVHYPAVHNFSLYSRYSTPLPKTEYVTDNVITLPLYFNLESADIHYISECLTRILN